MSTEFHETPRIPSYILALLVSDFSCINGNAKMKLSSDVTVGVCARPNAINQMGKTLNYTIYLLEFFESYFKVAYPLTKIGKD